jgi:DNA-directed RNA polymerase subunit RPC12/RpoP
MRDVIGVSVMFLAVGCALSPGVQNLQPVVAAAGQYALMAAPDAGPSPAPKPAGKCGTCGAPVPPGGGTLGDGTVKVPCPECNIKAALTQPKACAQCGGDGIYEKEGKRWKCNQCSTAP